MHGTPRIPKKAKEALNNELYRRRPLTERRKIQRIYDSGFARVIPWIYGPGFARGLPWIYDPGFARVIPWICDPGVARVIPWVYDLGFARTLSRIKGRLGGLDTEREF